MSFSLHCASRATWLAVFALALLARAPAAQGQTAVFEVEDSGGTSLLKLDTGEGLLIPGTLGKGVIPAEGVGTRLLWYPGKAAFRAGFVDGTQWDDANVGDYSIAMGNSTTASGFHSTAMGSSTTASGQYSTALGNSTTASGSHSTAMGSGTRASGWLSTAMGTSTTAWAYASVVIGRYNVVSGSDATWVDTEPLFVAGNGTDASSRSNALTLLKNGDMTIAGTLTQSSDTRLKTGIRPLTGALAAVTALQAVRYRFREGTRRAEGEHIGLLAQQVQAVLPELVSEGADGYLSVSYSKLAAVLAAAVGEQQGQIEEQQHQIEALRAENEALRSGLEALRAEVAALTDAMRAAPASRGED